MVRKLINIYRQYRAKKAQKLKALERELFIQNGQIPWSPGYWEYRNEQIAKSISNTEIVRLFRQGQVPRQFGYKLDERLVEYCWIFSQLPQEKIKLLDAGSTFNHDFIINHLDFSKIELSMLTYAPEYPNFNEKRISYIYADLRDIPLKDESYDVILIWITLCMGTIYNIIRKKMLNLTNIYLKAVAEMFRVLKQGGKLLLTFPYGKFENHGFFQQFDEEMLNRILSFFDKKGTFTTSFFRYLPDGWIACEKEDCKDVESFNPHTGRGKGTDGAAHCRSICCISFQKNK
jgi:SAM-dependent methyltransferase